MTCLFSTKYGLSYTAGKVLSPAFQIRAHQCCAWAHCALIGEFTVFSYGNTMLFLFVGVAVLLVSEVTDRKRSLSGRIATSLESSYMNWVTWSGSGTSTRARTATITSRLWRKTLCRVSTHASWPRHTRHDRNNYVQMVKKNYKCAKCSSSLWV